MPVRNWNKLLNPERRTNPKPFRLCLTLALVATAALAQTQQQDRYYIFNGKALEATDVNPVAATNTRWQVWLYPEGVRIPSRTAGLQYSRWGLVEGNSPQDVMRRLENSQRFERAYRNFFESGAWGRYTFFNPVGPIAITDRNLEDQTMLQKVYQVRWLSDRLDKLASAIAPSLENNESDPASPAREYFDQFRDAQLQVCKVFSQMSRNRLELRFINNGIARAKTEITNAENNAAKITAILPSVKLPASKAWMSYAERGGSDGTIQVEITETESAVSVQRTWIGGDGSMTGTVILTKIPYADLAKVDLQPPIKGSDEWRVRVESAARAFPQTITSPERRNARRTFPPVTYTTAESSAYFVFMSSKQAQDAYSYFRYHEQLGR